jgi:hypothetical protein
MVAKGTEDENVTQTENENGLQIANNEIENGKLEIVTAPPTNATQSASKPSLE